MLNFLSKHLRTDVRYIIKGGGFMAVGQVGVTIVAVVSSIAFANLLPKSEFGVYQYILATIELILILSLTGSGRALVVSISNGFDGSFSKGFKTSNLAGIPAILIGFTVGLYYLYNGNYILGLGIFLGVPTMLLITNFKLYIPFLNGKQLFHLSSLYSFINIFITSVVVITVLLITNNILYILLAFLGTNLIINFTLFLTSRKFEKNTEEDSSLFNRSFHLSTQGIIGHIASQADRILLFQFAGPIVLAEFWLAQNIQRQFSHLFKSTKAIVIPKLSQQTIPNLRKTLLRKVAFLYIFILPFTLLYVLTLPFIFNILFSEYSSSIIYAQFFGILFFFLPFKIIGDIFISHGMNSILYKMTLISSSSKLILTICLVPFFGIWGVIISTTLDQLISTILVLWYFYKLK